jgi:hypothetical protein
LPTFFLGPTSPTARYWSDSPDSARTALEKSFVVVGGLPLHGKVHRVAVRHRFLAQRAQLISRGFEKRDANGNDTAVHRAVLLPQGFSRLIRFAIKMHLSRKIK